MQTFTGKVISNKMQNTVVVVVESARAHPKYHKIIKKTSKIKAHNTIGNIEIGQMVVIASTRPISKDKHFLVKEVVNKPVTQLPNKPVKTKKPENETK